MKTPTIADCRRHKPLAKAQVTSSDIAWVSSDEKSIAMVCRSHVPPEPDVTSSPRWFDRIPKNYLEDKHLFAQHAAKAKMPQAIEQSPDHIRF